MANENEDIKSNPESNSGTPQHHQSWLGHIVEEVKEKMDELIEEAETSMNDGGFSALGNGHINVVHDHHKHHDTEAKQEEKAEEKKEEPHQSWLGHVVDEAKEKLDELVEEAQTSMNDGGFSALGNGHINVVHDHHKHPDAEKKEEKTGE